MQQVSALNVTPAAGTLVAFGDTVRLVAEAVDPNGHPVPGTEVSWESSDASVATVDGSGLVTAVANGTATVTATAGAASGTAAVTVMQQVSALNVTPDADTLVALGDTVPLVAEAVDANGHPVAGTEVSWRSSDASVAAVDGSGLVTAVANGTATVTATAGAASGTAAVTVMQQVSALDVTPAAATLVAVGDTVRLVAKAFDANGHRVAGTEVSWRSSEASVAAVDGSGLVTAVANGTANIMATAGGASGTAAVTVTQQVSALNVTPPAATLVAFGDTVRLVAEAIDANGRPVPGIEASWRSSDASVASVDGSGLVIAVANGTATVTATAGAASATAAVTVMQQVSALNVTPSADTLVAVGDTVRLVAEAVDANGHPVAGTEVWWASSDASVASVDESGLVTAVANGTATVTATAGAASGTAAVTVMQQVSALSVTPAEATLVVGDTLRFSAEAMDANSQPVRGTEFAWASSDTRVATVDSSGLVTGNGVGEVEISASSSGVVGRAALVVETPRPRVSVSTSAVAEPEGGEAVIEISVDAPPESSLSVRYLLGQDTDTDTDNADPRDYSDDGGGSVEIAAGAMGTSIKIGIVDDRIAEPVREVFEVALATPAAGAGYALGASASAVVTIEEGVCDRTPVIRSELLRQIEAEDCTKPDKSDLAEIRSIEICFMKYGWIGGCEDREELLITRLRQGDFLDLSGLRTLGLRGHELGRLPARIFAGLTELQHLDLSRSGLTGTPSGLFSGLSNLSFLQLFDNHLTTLPRGIFSDLPRLETLVLGANAIDDLPAGLFRGLSNLTSLYLSYNNLAELPAGVLRDLSQLQTLDLSHNQLTELPAGLFSRLPHLWSFDVDANPGSPFALTLELLRTNTNDPAAPGSAGAKVTLAEGAPFAMDIGLSARGAVLSANRVRLAAGATESREIIVTPNAGSAVSLSVKSVPEACDQCSGVFIVAGNPLVLANPESTVVSARAAYLTQGTQNLRTEVPLIAEREALLRVFATTRDINNFNLEGRATFFRSGREVHRTSLGILRGIPTDVDESRLELSLNAKIPARVLQPGLELVVELDPNGKLPLREGSRTRLPAEGRLRLEVRHLPRLDITVVPVSYHTKANQGTNRAIIDFVRDLANSDSRETMSRVRGVMPVGDMRVKLRDPYVTWADTTAGGIFELLSEIDLIRHLEAEGTGEYYHGIFAYPRQRVSPRWIGGVAYLGGYSAVSWWAPSAMTRNTGIARLFAHEFGHNLSLLHAPCNVSSSDPYLDREFPYAHGNIGVWGHTFLKPSASRFGRLYHPVETTDVMGYCHGVSWWLSDHNFVKAFEHRLTMASAASATRNLDPEETLILWGGIHDGSPVLEAPFAYNARVKLPDSPGAYRLEGLDTRGRKLFSLSFEPDAMGHGAGRGFLFAIPLDPDWIDALDRVVLSGAEGSTVVSLDNAEGPVMWVDRLTGTVRGIAREAPEQPPAILAAEVEAGRLDVVRGLSKR